ncbi:MCE family protein [Thermoleophilia bacterium SCSIO 60948]|nr:MCE family protein [Thermoleophilia bacterium SCSIO 60948]
MQAVSGPFVSRARRLLRPRGPQPRFGRRAIALQALLALGFVVWMLAREGVDPPFFGPDRIELRAEFPDAAGLAGDADAPVTVAGVEAGAVTDVEVEAGRAMATLRIDAEAARTLGPDARARVVPRSALQDLTVDLDPGSGGGGLDDGDEIPASRTSTTVGSDRLMSILDADTRAQVGVLLGELRVGLDGRAGELRDSLAELAELTDSADLLAARLDRRRALLARFVDEVDALAGELGSHDRALTGAIEFADRTLAVTAVNDEAIASTLAELPPTMDAARGALGEVESLSEPLAPALADLRPLAARLPGTLTAVREFVPEGRGLIADVDDLAERGGAGIDAARRVLDRIGPVAEESRESIADAGSVVEAIDRNKEGIGVLGDRFSGVFSTNDANGPILRGLGFFEPVDPENLGFPDDGSDASAEAARADAARALTRVCLEQNDTACLARYLVPSLPGSAVEPLGDRP